SDYDFQQQLKEKASLNIGYSTPANSTTTVVPYKVAYNHLE
ncbi:6112_t:CDS:2, partial [Entrophospora sp. SA101]